MYSLPSRFHLIHNVVTPGSVGAEIGVWRGDFAEELRKTTAAKIFLVDSWQQYAAYHADMCSPSETHEQALARVKERFDYDLKLGRMEIVRGFSLVAATNHQTPTLDWIYLDANHQYEFVLLDLIAWSWRIKPGGCIMGHDFCHRPEERFGVIEAVEEFCEKFNWRLGGTTEEPVSSYALYRNE